MHSKLLKSAMNSSKSNSGSNSAFCWMSLSSSDVNARSGLMFLNMSQYFSMIFLSFSVGCLLLLFCCFLLLVVRRMFLSILGW
nr:MAG: hypothetical protein [Helarchaeota virus Nidhogg Meg22_1012]